jgi:predicted RNA-binding Zn ribbon-like protein
LEFRFKGGDLALDFVATVGERWRGNFERLRSPADLDGWSAQAGLGAPSPPASEGDLLQARELREAIHRAVRSAMDAADIAAVDRQIINSWAGRADIAPQLGADGRASWAGRPSVDSVLATIARHAVLLLGGDQAARLRECAADNCSTLFVDSSRGAARRWCSKHCADRVNAHQYRSRRNSETRSHTGRGRP